MLDYKIIDFDQHYYETDDCCTRYLQPKFRDRAVRIDEYQGERAWFFGDEPLSFDRRPLDTVPKPGELRRFRKNQAKGNEVQMGRMLSTDEPAFRDREARLVKLDEFGVEASVMFSSFFFENEGARDPEAVCANLRAYNQWVADDWGWDYKDRLFATASLTLIDLAFAMDELERVLKEGARLILLRTGPISGRSPADPYFDPFWARVNEACIPVVLHVSLSTYETEISRLWGEKADATMAEFSAFQWYSCFMQRPIVDTLASIIFSNLFGRFPKLKILSIENGSSWVPGFLRDLDHIMNFTNSVTTVWSGGHLAVKPSEIFRKHVYVAPFFEPYYETSMDELVDVLGIDNLIFGSDWPHSEGKEFPLDYLSDVVGLSGGMVKQFMRKNGQDLLGLL